MVMFQDSTRPKVALMMVNETNNNPLWSSRGRKYRRMIRKKGKNNDFHALDSATWATVPRTSRHNTYMYT